MKIVALVSLLVVAYVGYEIVRMYPLWRTASEMVRGAERYTREGERGAMVVLGDSTAVGVGAENPEDSIAGRIAADNPTWAVENYAVSGARINDLESQMQRATRERYTLAVVQIGANDIIRFMSAKSAVRELESVLTALAAKSDRVILLSAGNVGGTQFFPTILNPLYHRLTLSYHREFERLAKEIGITYVNLYTPPESDPFIKEPEVYLAPDGLHPSSEGYRLWYEHIEKL